MTQYKLIRRLADGRFHSGEELARDFGISRAAIWKQLRGLREVLSINVHAVRGRGYRLARPIELLDRDKILEALPKDVLAAVSQLLVHDQIDSTNACLMSQAEKAAPSGTLCLAEQQTAGRGRRGRAWVSPFGHNIYLSLLWRYELSPTHLSGLSLACGIAVLRAIRRLGVQDIGLKWPNDILSRDRKLAGLLLEMAGETGGPSLVVVGVGVNVRMSALEGEAIDQPWIDLASLCRDGDQSRNRLIALLVEELITMLKAFERQGMVPLVEEWNRFDLFCGKPVTLQSGQHRVEGICRGIDSDGALLLAREDGITAYHGGELSLRGRE